MAIAVAMNCTSYMTDTDWVFYTCPLLPAFPMQVLCVRFFKFCGDDCEHGNIKIKIIADPRAKTNNHEIICKGSFGAITAKTENFPSKNPRTSHLAILSAVQTLKDIKDST